jgi:hypothetical protein
MSETGDGDVKTTIACRREVVDGVEHGRSAPIPMGRPTCACGETGIRSEHYDCYYCPKGGVWLEDNFHEGCDDCYYCGKRPARAF